MIKQINEIPKCVETEKALLGCLINNPKETITEINNRITYRDFWDLTCKDLFKTADSIYRRDGGLDIATLKDNTNVKLSNIVDLQNYPSSITDLDTYIKRIKNASNLRKLISAGAKIQELGASEKDLDEILQEGTKLLSEIEYKENDRVKNMTEMLTDAMQRYEDRVKNKGILGLPSGFIDLDRMIHGFKESTLAIIAARPSVGKTSFMLDIARNIIKKGYTALIFSLEQSYEELTDKLICSEGGINLWKMRNGKTDDQVETKYAEALGRLGDCKMIIDDNGAINPNHIRSTIKQQRKKQKIDIIMVDYLGLMSSGFKTSGQTEEVTKISQQLKAIAKEFKLPLIALSQLSRKIEQRGDKSPKLSDLRDSGSIEQDADIVMFLSRDFDKPEQQPMYDVQVSILKHRAGPIGLVELWFDANTTSFKNKEKNEF